MSRAVRRTIASHALAAVGMSLPWPLLVLLVWQRAGDGWVLGLAGAARMLPYVALSWCAGRLADRFARDRIVRLTLWARLLLLTAAAVAGVLGETWLALVATTATIAAATPAYPALAAAMPGLAGRQSNRATGLLVTCEVTSFVVGPALGGLLLVPATRALVPWAAVAATAAALLVFDGVRLPAPGGRVPGADGRGVLAALRTSPVLRGAVLAVAVVNAAGSVLALTLLPLTAEWGPGAAQFGLATGVLGFGALGGPLLARLGARWTWDVRPWLLVLGACLLAVVLAPGLAVAAVPIALAGAVSVQVETAATEVVQAAAADHLRASVLGVTDTAMVAAALLGALTAPTLAALAGPRVLVAAVAVLVAATLALARRSPAVPVEAATEPVAV